MSYSVTSVPSSVPKGFKQLAIVDPAPESPQEEDSKHATIVSKSDPAKRQSTSESFSSASMTMFMNSAGEITMPNGDVFVKKKGSSL